MTELSHNGTYSNDSDIGQASQWNGNLTKILQTKLEDITIDANFAWLLFSLLIALIWFTYITHYSSRVIGQILTRLLNHFAIGSGYIRIGKYLVILLMLFACKNFLFIFLSIRFTYVGCISWKDNVS